MCNQRKSDVSEKCAYLLLHPNVLAQEGRDIESWPSQVGTALQAVRRIAGIATCNQRKSDVSEKRPYLLLHPNLLAQQGRDIEILAISERAGYPRRPSNCWDYE